MVLSVRRRWCPVLYNKLRLCNSLKLWTGQAEESISAVQQWPKRNPIGQIYHSQQQYTSYVQIVNPYGIRIEFAWPNRKRRVNKKIIPLKPLPLGNFIKFKSFHFAFVVREIESNLVLNLPYFESPFFHRVLRRNKISSSANDDERQAVGELNKHQVD